MFIASLLCLVVGFGGVAEGVCLFGNYTSVCLSMSLSHDDACIKNESSSRRLERVSRPAARLGVGCVYLKSRSRPRICLVSRSDGKMRRHRFSSGLKWGAWRSFVVGSLRLSATAARCNNSAPCRVRCA